MPSYPYKPFPTAAQRAYEAAEAAGRDTLAEALQAHRESIGMNPNLEDRVLSRLEDDEGWSAMPYDDHLGHLTIAYGCLLPLTHAEGRLLLRHRLRGMYDELTDKIEVKHDLLFNNLPDKVKEGLLNMGYQLGVPRLMKFKRMWAAIKRMDWVGAQSEALDSRWAQQTPARAQRVATLIGNGNEPGSV